jgi:hypothetical protein
LQAQENNPPKSSDFRGAYIWDASRKNIRCSNQTGRKKTKNI